MSCALFPPPVPPHVSLNEGSSTSLETDLVDSLLPDAPSCSDAQGQARLGRYTLIVYGKEGPSSATSLGPLRERAADKGGPQQEGQRAIPTVRGEITNVFQACYPPPSSTAYKAPGPYFTPTSYLKKEGPLSLCKDPIFSSSQRKSLSESLVPSMREETHMSLEGKQMRKEAREQVAMAATEMGLKEVRRWSHERTQDWWRRREEERQGQGGREQENREENKKQRKSRREQEVELRAISATYAALRNCLVEEASLKTEVQESPSTRAKKRTKPLLPAPRIGVFALYYILTKIGVVSDAVSTYSAKQEITLVDQESTECHRQRLQEMEVAFKKEKESERWGMLAKLCSWIGSLVGIVTGVALIATGVGAVAGALVLAGGVIQMGSGLMEFLGGWQKVAALLPGEDAEKKRAVVTWMQLGIAVLALILSLVGLIWGGFPEFKNAIGVGAAFIGCVSSLGSGVSTIAEGIYRSEEQMQLSAAKKQERRIAELKAARQELMETLNWGVERLEKFFEDLAQVLQFEQELFYADQILYRG